jgi:Holliday junction resolvase RusA-like endonuclease
MPEHYMAFRELVAHHAMVEAGKLNHRGDDWNAHAEAYEVRVRFYQPTRRNIDVDNAVGACLDSLNGCLYADDGLVKRAIVEKGYDKANPRTEVTLVALTSDGLALDEAERCKFWDEVF